MAMATIRNYHDDASTDDSDYANFLSLDGGSDAAPEKPAAYPTETVPTITRMEDEACIEEGILPGRSRSDDAEVDAVDVTDDVGAHQSTNESSAPSEAPFAPPPPSPALIGKNVSFADDLGPLPQNRLSDASDVSLSAASHDASDSAPQRQLLHERSKARLSSSEAHSSVQPGRRLGSLLAAKDAPSRSSAQFARRRATYTIPKIVDFFRRVELSFILGNVAVSAALTALVIYAFPESWRTRLKGASASAAILGSFLSFALVLRTQSCYGRWWEGRTMWGKMTSDCVQLSMQARSNFGDLGVDDCGVSGGCELADEFLSRVIAFPYACKAVLRGNQLEASPEEGPRLVASGVLSDHELDEMIRHGAPFYCIDALRRSAIKGLRGGGLPPEMVGGALLAMEQVLFELNLNFGACLKINSTNMPNSYDVFMRSFVILYFAWASLQWSPTIEWLTPIVIGFMVFLINTIIVIGDLMIRPFDLQWGGLPLQKYCVIIEKEVLNVSRRHVDFSKRE